MEGVRARREETWRREFKGNQTSFPHKCHVSLLSKMFGMVCKGLTQHWFSISDWENQFLGGIYPGDYFLKLLKAKASSEMMLKSM